MSRILTDRLAGGATVRAPKRAMRLHDPFDSGMWPVHRREFLGDPEVWRHDPAVRVLAPGRAEDAAHVPILIDATDLAEPVERIVVTVDYSPIPRALKFYPMRARALLGFGVKYEIGGALRAAAEVARGEWAVGGAFIEAMGGGCSAPAAAHARADWQMGFGEMRGRLWRRSGRLRVGLRHPQDTGLADGIPAHHLTEITLHDVHGEAFSRIELGAPVEENPVFTFSLPDALARTSVTVSARDNNGYKFDGRVEISS
jgi:sulfur-oxidizing protein SoxY